MKGKKKDKKKKKAKAKKLKTSSKTSSNKALKYSNKVSPTLITTKMKIKNNKPKSPKMKLYIIILFATDAKNPTSQESDTNVPYVKISTTVNNVKKKTNTTTHF